MKELDFTPETQDLSKSENVRMLKDAETVAYEKKHREEYEARREEHRRATVERVNERLNNIRETLNDFEEQGLTTLDGGITHQDMPEGSAGKHLTHREILFCKYYVATANLGQALNLAGMSKRERYILSKPEVRAYCAELTDLRLKKLGYDRNTVIENLAIIANQDIKDYMDIVRNTIQTAKGATYVRTDVELKTLDEIDTEYLTDELGDPILDNNGNKIKISSGKTKAIKSIRYNDNGKVIIDFYDKLTALKQLQGLLDMEPATKITLNDETHRAETEKALLEKLKAFSNKVEKIETNNEESNNSDKTGENADSIEG